MARHRPLFAALICLLWQPAFARAQSFWERPASSGTGGWTAVFSTEYSVLSTQYSVLGTPSPDQTAEAPENEFYTRRGPIALIRDEAIDGTRDFLSRMFLDFEHQYTGRRLYVLGGALGVAAVLANTHADQGVRDWYQNHVRSTGTDELARVVNFMGDYHRTGTVAIGAWGLGRLTERLLDDQPAGRAGAWLGDWGNRTVRGLLVGAPTVGVLQVALGASRPDENRGSAWHPFRDSNSVSGHAFVGAVPFLTAMRMTESRPLQATFFAGSFLTVFGRINNDDHYLSQVMLGWTIALLASGSVAETDAQLPYRWRIVPVEIPNGVGVGVEFRY